MEDYFLGSRTILLWISKKPTFKVIIPCIEDAFKLKMCDLLIEDWLWDEEKLNKWLWERILPEFGQSYMSNNDS